MPLPTSDIFMKKAPTLFLKGVVLLLGIGAFVGLLWFPQTEGRAAQLDLIDIYKDPFIIYLYAASIPFFVGLYQTFKLLDLIEANSIFSQVAVNALKNIKIVSLCLIGLIIAAELYLRFFAQGDDPAGPTTLGAVVILAIAIITTIAALGQKLLQNAVDIKSENDLTV